MLDRLTPEMTKHVISVINDEIATHFKPGGRKYPGGQRAIAAKFRLAQPTLNRFLKKGEGLGLDMLLGLRAYFHDAGRPKTIDEILGIEVAAPAPKLDAEQLLEKLSQLEQGLRALASQRKPSQKAARILAEAERARLVAVGQAHLDTKTQAGEPPRRTRKATG